MLYDGSMDVKRVAETTASEHHDTMRTRTHRMNDYFYETQLYSKSVREQNLIFSERYRSRHYISELAKIMKENEGREIKTHVQ